MKTCPTCKSNHSDHYSHCPLDGTPLIEASMWVEGAVIRGKYRILAKIGQGGMATVYKVQHTYFHEMRALKVMAPELAKDPIFRKRFEHEAVLTRRLQHPNAVRVEDLDEAEDGRPFMVMEYIEGRSLRAVIAQEAPLPAGRACTIAKQVASALEAAHRLGMVHRDIKPANIVLVSPVSSHDLPTLAGEVFPQSVTSQVTTSANRPITQSPDYSVAKVLDFGIAKIKEGTLETTGMAGTLTGTGMAIGTAAYMSPEQALGKKGDELDCRSDIYSLGVVMYQMLTGELPLQADTPIQMLMAHIQTPPRPILEAAGGAQIPAALAGMVMRCLEKDRQLRPASAAAFIDELDRAMLPKPRSPAISMGVIQESSLPQSAVIPSTDQLPPQGPAAGISRLVKWSGLFTAAIIILVGALLFVNSRPAANRPGKNNPPGSRSESRTVPSQPSAPSAIGAGFQNPSVESGGATQQAVSPSGSRPKPAPQPKSTETPRRSTTSAVRKPPVESPPRPPEAPTITSAPSETKISAEQLAEQINAAKTKGDLLYENGDYDNAIAAYQSGLKLDPNNSELLLKIQKARTAKAAESSLQ